MMFSHRDRIGTLIVSTSPLPSHTMIVVDNR